MSSGAPVLGCIIYTPDLIHKGHHLDSTCRFLGTPVFWEALGFQLTGSLYECCVILVQLLRFKVLSE